MPISRFDTSVTPEYVSNRIQIPFQELNAMAANQQKSFNEGKALEDDLGALGQAIKAAPMYEGHRQAFINEYKTKIKDLTGNGNINYADPEFKRKASMLVNEFKSRPEINAFANTLKSFQDWESQVKNPDNARNLDFTYTKDKQGNFNQLDVNKQGVYSPRYTKYSDYDKIAKDVMGPVAKDAKSWEGKYDLTNVQTGNNGETMVYNKTTGGYDGVSVDKLKSLANIVLPNYISSNKHQLESILRSVPEIGDKAYNASYDELSTAARTDPKAKQIKDYVDNKMLSTLIAGNAHQVGMSTKQGIQEHFDTDRQAVAKNDNTDFGNKRLPMHELPASTPGEVTNKDALNVFGLGDNRNEDGTLKSDLYEKQNDLPSNYGMTTQGLPGGEQHKIDKVTGSTDTPQNKLVVEYTNLLNTAKAIGLPIPKLKNGSTDFETLQSKMIEAGKNQLINGDVGQGLQAKLAANMTTYYGGDINEKGDVKLSSFMETAKINEIGNNAELKTDEQKRDLVKNGVIKDINFYAEQPGTVVWSSDDGTNIKDYNVYLGEKTLKELTRPTWELTKSFEDNRTTKMNTPEEIKNYTKKQVDLDKAELNITNYLSNKYLSIKDPNVRQQVLDKTKSTLGELNGYKTTGINYSAEKITDGNNKGESRYIFVGKQGTDPYTNQPSDKVMVIDQTSGLVRVQDLNEVQAQESSYIQQVIAPGYKK